MIWKFGLSNIRRLPLVDLIDLKPITILVGRNSSGKSTFLRSLPLLRQSITTKTSSPVLWYGDLVDFGSFEISAHDKALPIGFSFYTDQLLPSTRQVARHMYMREGNTVFQRVRYDVKIIPHGQRTRISEIALSIESPSIKYNIFVNDDNEIERVVVNGKDVIISPAGISLDISSGSIFPDVNLIRKRGEKRIGNSYLHYKIDNLRDRIPEVLYHFLREYLGDNDHKILDLSTDILSSDLPDTDDNSLRSMYGFKSWGAWKNFVNRSSYDKGLHESFMTAIYLSMLPDMMNRASESFRLLTSQSLYIGPARSRSDRYYRYQDLSVSEIDPDGKNFPMFLNSLSDLQIADMSSWINALFGYGLSVSRSEGHISLKLVEGDVEFNIK
jgi:hypothetical protein